MHHLIIYEIVFIVIIQYILAVFGEKPKVTNPCPNDFLRIYNKCYYFSSDYETWDKAKWKCEDRNSTLAIITNKNQNVALTEFLRRGHYEEQEPLSSRIKTHIPRWMGGQYDFKSGHWKWAYNGKMIRYNQFDNVSKNLEWHCLIINPNNNYKWGSSKCFEKNYYICQTRASNLKLEAANISVINNNSKNQNNNKINSTEQHDSQPGFYIVDATVHTSETAIKESKPKKPKNKFICPKDQVLLGKKCYFMSRDKAKWDEAYYKCQDMSSELAVIKNKRMDVRLQTKLKRMKLATEKRWIGGKLDMINNQWIWVNSGAKMPFQPHLTINSDWACVLWDPLANRWTSESCLLPMYYMCQTDAKPVDNRKLRSWKKKKLLQAKALTQRTH